MRRTIVSLVSSGIVFGAALSEARLALGQQRPQAPPGQVAVIRIAVIDRTTQAINYRPRQGETEIDFAATALLPSAHGRATVSGEKGYMRIDARFERLQPPRSFGREYLTYVLWAITPEGRATNLGEVQYDDADARVKVTTELQAFGLIVTAEPYFAVTQPSDVVVLENAVRDGTRGKVETIQARYELLRRGTYLMDRDPEALQVKALEPGAPLDLAQARNAVELARLAGADQYAQDSFARAVRLLADAETARQRGRKGNDVMMPARQAAQTAEDARLVAVRQQQEAVLAEERAQSLQRERDALDRARIEEGRRLQAEQDARAEQERRRQAQLDAEASRLQAEREAQAEQERRRQAEVAAQTAALDKAAAERERVDALAAREAADEARRDAESSRAAAQNQAQRAETAAAQAEREKSELRAKVQEQLNVILETRETARGLVVNVSDVLFDTGSATLKPGAREKLARVAGVLLAHPGLNVAIEGHTDSVGTESSNQRLSEQRAQAVHDYLVTQGIPQLAVGTSGFGESQPVASNDTAAGRQQNRRVELVVTGESIGR